LPVISKSFYFKIYKQINHKHMKRVLLTLTVLGSLLLGSCEKEALVTPGDSTLIKADKGINSICRGCAQWDLEESQAQSEAATYRSAAPVDTVATPAKVVKPVKQKK